MCPSPQIDSDRAFAIKPEERICVLLGAGASVDAGIPDSYEMTKVIVEQITSESPWTDTTKLINFVCGALVAYDTRRGSSGVFDALDVERVFAAIELLAARHELEVTPFVSRWDAAVDKWDTPSKSGFFDQDFQRALMNNYGGNPIRGVIEKLVREETGTGNGAIYKRVSDLLVEHLRRAIGRQPKNVAYLRPMVEWGARRAEGLSIATLNYDLAIEGAAEHSGLAAHTGILNWSSSEMWNWDDHQIRLLKLHGSINWAWDWPDFNPGTLRQPTVVESTDPVNEHRKPALVFGAQGKLRADGPFLSLLDSFANELKASDKLVTIGCSFRDEHVNHVIRKWMSGHPERILAVVDPGFPKYPTDRYGEELSFADELLSAFRDPTRPEHHVRLEVARQTAKDAIPEIFTS